MSNRALTWAFAQELPTTPKFVLVALADLADEGDSCYPSQKYLARSIGAAERTVREALARLEREGYITRKQRRRADGSRSSDRFLLLIHSPSTGG